MAENQAQQRAPQQQPQGVMLGEYLDDGEKYVLGMLIKMDKLRMSMKQQQDLQIALVNQYNEAVKANKDLANKVRELETKILDLTRDGVKGQDIETTEAASTSKLPENTMEEGTLEPGETGTE